MPHPFERRARTFPDAMLANISQWSQTWTWGPGGGGGSRDPGEFRGSCGDQSVLWGSEGPVEFRGPVGIRESWGDREVPG